MRTYCEKELRDLVKGKRLLVVAYEAGASQIVSSFVKRAACKDTTFIIDGPAIGIFKSKLGRIKIRALAKEHVQSSDIVITGTSLIPDLERNAIALARINRKFCISVIDHWVNYLDRFMPVFQRNKRSPLQEYFPDEVWITDEYAYRLALEAGIPRERLARIENFYLSEFARKVSRMKRVPKKGRAILYISEPVYDDVKIIHGDGNAFGYNEYDLATDVIGNLGSLEGRFDKLIFRLHPNEPVHKYNEILSRYKGKMRIEVTSSKISRLEDDCFESDCVVGVESMALVIAMMLGKKVFSCIPRNAKKKSALPHKELAHINSFSQLSRYA